MTAPPLDEVDLTDLDLFASGFPDEIFTVLRSEAPVWWHRPTVHTPGGVGFWVVSRHADAMTVMSDPHTYSSERAPGCEGGGTLIEDLPHGSAAGVLFNMMDDPRHKAIRSLVTPAFSPRELAPLETELRSRTATLLESAGAKERCDFLLAVAAELPMQATASLMGVPLEDRHDLMEWSNATLDHSGRELGESSDPAVEAAAAMAEYGSKLMRAKRATECGDVLGMIAHGRIDGPDGSECPLSEMEQLMFFSLLSFAGSETTRNAIALGVAALAEHPEQMDLLRADPSTMVGAAEEILRWSSPTLYNRRTATCDAELCGQRIAVGDKVTVWWASANRDESVFADPFRFDVSRDPNPHLAFGYRGHFCLGAALARLEIRVLLEELVARFAEIRLDGPIERFRTNKHAGVKRMPVILRRS
ncbi:MAG: cytochrome P450 [Acidimicrobiales bacterium]